MDEDPHELLAELDLDPPRTQGNVRRPLGHIEYVRDLTQADLAALSQPRGVTAKSLLRIHASHHALARCIAAGMKPSQAALVTGYDAARISVLQSDPAFTALVADYQNESKAIFADLAERMNNMSLDAIELLQARLHESPQEFTPGMLLDVIKTFADRTGHGPGQDVNVKMSMDLVDRPPRESFEDWEARRARELGQGPTARTNELTVIDGGKILPMPVPDKSKGAGVHDSSPSEGSANGESVPDKCKTES